MKTLSLPSPPPLPTTRREILSLCIACDQNYAAHLSALLLSILKNHTGERHLDIIIIDRGLNKSQRESLAQTARNYDTDLCFIELEAIFNEISVHSYFTSTTLYRLVLPELLSNRDKILYLDTDVIVNCDLSGLYDTDLSDNYLAATRDLVMKIFVKMNVPCDEDIFNGSAKDYLREKLHLDDIDNYFQAGTLLLNLELLRDHGKTAPMLQDLYENKFWFLDQDILNKHLGRKVVLLENHYNTVDFPIKDQKYLSPEDKSAYLKSMKDPHIIHYAGIAKPWLNSSHSLSHYYWDYLKMTDWYEPTLQKFNVSEKKYQAERLAQRPTFKKRVARTRRKILNLFNS